MANLDAILKRLTVNGAHNLMGTIKSPSETYPDLINGDRRIDTGIGKWTHIAALGVQRHLCALGLAEIRKLNAGEGKTWPMTVITPLGREVASYLIAHWDEVRSQLRDLS